MTDTEHSTTSSSNEEDRIFSNDRLYLKKLNSTYTGDKDKLSYQYDVHMKKGSSK